jgi:hypothetical protein
MSETLGCVHEWCRYWSLVPPSLAVLLFGLTCIAYYGLNLYRNPPLTCPSLVVYPLGPLGTQQSGCAASCVYSVCSCGGLLLLLLLPRWPACCCCLLLLLVAAACCCLLVAAACSCWWLAAAFVDSGQHTLRCVGVPFALSCVAELDTGRQIPAIRFHSPHEVCAVRFRGTTGP